MDLTGILVPVLIGLFLAFCYLAYRFWQISPQMSALQSDLRETRRELTLTRDENKCLQEALKKTTTSQEELQEVLQACTRAHVEKDE